MKKIYYICMLLLFTIYIPRVYAFTYDITLDNDVNSGVKGTVTEVNVSLKNVDGTDDGIAACSMNIMFDESLSLVGEVRASNGWNVIVGDVYMFDTGNFVLSSSEMFTFSVRINGNGNVKLTNIKCSDGNTMVDGKEKNLHFSVVENISDNKNSDIDKDYKNEEFIGLSSIELSEGIIEFDPEVTEYWITVTDFEKLEILPKLADVSYKYIIDKIDDGEDKQVSITFTGQNDFSKTYIIHVAEEDAIIDSEIKKEKKNYAPIFITIICILVAINIYRIVRNMKK